MTEAVSFPSTVFSTTDLPPRDRLEAWRGVFNGVNEIEASQESRHAFDGRSEHWRIGPFLFGVSHNPERRLLRDRARVRRDDLDHWAIRIPLTMTCYYQIRDHSFVCRPGAAAITSLAVGYVEENTGGEAIGLIFPRDAYPQLTARLDAIGPDALPHTAAGALFGDFLRSLRVRLASASADEVPALAEITRAMLAACLPAADAAAMDGAEGVRRLKVERVIRRHIGSARLDIDRICGLAGVSRSTLYRMFEHEGGVATYIRRLRLRLILQDLESPDLAVEAIAVLAERRGFHCAASFSRSFREAFGQSPREAREAALSGVVPAACRIKAGRRSRPVARTSSAVPSLFDILP